VTISARAAIATGYWDTQSGVPTSAPGTGKYRADNWAAPTLIAVAGTDANGYDRQAGLITAQPGDAIWQRSPSDSQNYQEWAVASVTDMGTWAQFGVSVTASGATFTAPGSNQRRLLELLQLEAPPPDGGGEVTPLWQTWAPPLDPPTAGGLPADVAQVIADATWDTDPHLCAALQWEAYAATLPFTAAVSQVATGAQSVTYSPPLPGGDAGAALAKAAWHRSLMQAGGAIPLDLAPPMRQTVTGAEPVVVWQSWWEDA
jgi:hypothetical protein